VATAFRLVIVDDHELLATALALSLRLVGLDVDTAAGPTAEDVVATVRRRAPALVLLDLDLGPPLGSGLDLIQPLIAAGGRVVMMTAVDDRARLGACIEVGAAGIVSKKAGFDNLVDAIRRAVDGRELLTDHYRAHLLEELRAQRQALMTQPSPLAV
jgi:DNA-binding NarL/FixJ family response regulator